MERVTDLYIFVYIIACLDVILSQTFLIMSDEGKTCFKRALDYIDGLY